MKSQVYECPECGDRKMVDYSMAGKASTVKPTVWCPCDGFIVMDKVEH